MCYGRSVVYEEWPRMESGTQGDAINPWGVELFRTLQTVEPQTASEEAAYGKWLDQTSDREAARTDRIHGAVGVIPTPLWLLLLFISVVIFVFMLFFADRGEGAVTQAVLMGSVASVITAMLLLIQFLDNPFHDGVGGVRPVAMERTPATSSTRRCERRAFASWLPCDAMGNPSLVTAAHRRDWIEVAATVLLAIAAVATAWSSYQATRWNGEQAKASGSVNKTRIEAARASDLANAQQQVDVATFMQWVDSYARGETELVTFYRERFRPEFKPAFEAWIATKPLETKGAPLTPFVMPEYRLAARAEADRLDEDAEELSAQVRRNIQRASNYVLGVVLFAVALFFAGMSTKLTARGLRKAMLVVGYIVFLGAAVWIATSPVSIAV